MDDRMPESPLLPKPCWTYAYQVVPPQGETRMRSIKTLLDREHEEATRGARTWRGQMVREHQITHILIVTDNPEQDGAFNQRLEAALTELEAGFSRTAPLQVDSDRATDEG
jgi:hypothetical protein